MQYIYTFVLLLVSFSGILAQENGAIVENLMKNLPKGTEINKLEKGDHFNQEYEILMFQDLDHNDQSKGKFQRRIFLSHYDFDAPNVFVTEGYGARQRTYELSKILQANQIIVEYRYFGKSAPAEMDYQFLTNDQAMEDLHEIREIFGKMYKGKWLNTGISKGGTTTLIYTTKYPDDVDATVAYVGPLPKTREDKRMDDMIETMLDTCACGSDLDKLQRFALKNDKQIHPLIDSMARADSITFKRVGVEKALEYAVLELTFSFFQLGYKCADVPTELTVDTVFNYLNDIVGYDFYCDQGIEAFEPAFYQFMKENGYYGFINKPFKGLLDDLDVYDNEIFGPQGVNLEHDPEYLLKVRVDLYHRGDQIIYIHGANDPWAACRLIPPPERDAVYIEKIGADHRIRIKGLGQNEKEEVYKALKKWMKVPVYPLSDD